MGVESDGSEFNGTATYNLWIRRGIDQRVKREPYHQKILLRAKQKLPAAAKAAHVCCKLSQVPTPGKASFVPNWPEH